MNRVTLLPQIFIKSTYYNVISRLYSKWTYIVYDVLIDVTCMHIQHKQRIRTVQ